MEDDAIIIRKLKKDIKFYEEEVNDLIKQLKYQKNDNVDLHLLVQEQRREIRDLETRLRQSEGKEFHAQAALLHFKKLLNEANKKLLERSQP